MCVRSSVLCGSLCVLLGMEPLPGMAGKHSVGSYRSPGVLYFWAPTRDPDAPAHVLMFEQGWRVRQPWPLAVCVLI